MNSPEHNEDMAIIWLDPQWQLLDANEAAKEWLPVRISSRKGSPLEWYLSVEISSYDSPMSGEWGTSEMTVLFSEYFEENDVWKGHLRYRKDGEYYCDHDIRIIKSKSAASGITGYILTASTGHEISVIEGSPAFMGLNVVCNALDRPLIITDVSGIMRYCNEHVYKVNGDEPKNRIGKPIWDALEWRNLQEEKELLRKRLLLASEGIPQQMILKQGRRFADPDRSISNLVLTPVKNREGEISHIVIEEWSVPTSIQMEIKMRMTESVFRSFLVQSPLPTWLVDNEGKLIAMSETYADIFGLDTDDIGKDLMQLIPPRFVLQYTKNNEMVIKTGSHIHVLENWIKPEGDVHTYVVHKFPIKNGKEITMIGGIAFEVTEKIRLEQRIKNAYEKYLLANQATGDLIWDWDLGADLITILGDVGEENRAQEWKTLSPADFFAKVHPEDKTILENAFSAAIKDETVEYTIQVYRFVQKNGTHMQVVNRMQIHRDDHGQAYRIVGSSLRITENFRKTLGLHATPNIDFAFERSNSDVKLEKEIEKLSTLEQKLGSRHKELLIITPSWTDIRSENQMEKSVIDMLEQVYVQEDVKFDCSFGGFDRISDSNLIYKKMIPIIKEYVVHLYKSAGTSHVSIYGWISGGEAKLRMADDGSTILDEQDASRSVIDKISRITYENGYEIVESNFTSTGTLVEIKISLPVMK